MNHRTEFGNVMNSSAHGGLTARAYLAKPFIALLLLLTLSVSNVHAQTILNPGDIVFTGYNADFPGSSSTDGGQVSFLLLRDIDAGTTIFFTDFGWDADLGEFHTAAVTNDGVVEWVTASNISCGTEVVITAVSVTSATTNQGSVVSGGFTLNSSGDQISAYQGTFEDPTFISGLHADAGTYATSSPTNDRGSQLPEGLTIGISAFVIVPEIDNMVYSGSVINDVAENIRAAVYDNANWSTNNSVPQTLSTITWAVSACLNGPVDSEAPVLNTLTLDGSPGPNASTISYSAVFDEVANAVTPDDFSLTTTGTASAIIGLPTSSDGITYSIPVIDISGTGTIRLDLNASTDIVDDSGNGNGSNGFVEAKEGDDTHTVDVDLPSVTSISVSGAPGPEATSVSFMVTFNEPVTGVSLSDFSLDLSGVAATLANISGSGDTYTVDVDAIIGTGTVSIDLNAGGAITDIAGNTLIDAFTTGVEHNADVPIPVGGSTLAAGDLVFTGYNADFPGGSSIDGGQFSFLLLRDIDAGTTIFFTDFGWDADLGEFHTTAVTNDGVVEWVATSDISCGTEVVITSVSVASATADNGLVVSGGFTFNSSGDQVSAYQGAFNSPSFVSGLQADTGAYSTSSPTNDRGSQLPDGLVEGVSAFVIIPETDNMVYGGAVTVGTAEEIRTAINNNANWITDNSVPQSLSTIAWNLTTCLEIVDNIDPEILVSDITVDNDPGICGAIVTSFGASATDDSGTVDLVFDLAEGTEFAVGTTTVTATATDPSGNSAEATFDVTVNDVEIPILTLLGDAIVNLNLGDTYTEEGAVVSDNCPPSSPSIVGGDVVDVNVAGTYVVTYNATDASGNAATQITRTVNVLDNVGPVITVNDINIDSEPGECGANIFDYGASATDESGIADFNFSIPEGSVFDPGTTEVIAFASDNNGNVSQATFTVTINDVEAPVLVAQGITVALDENGFAELPPLNSEVILFQGTFDDDTPALNTNALVNWNVTQGNVDVYFGGQFGSPFADNALELSGSVNGAIESKEIFTLEPGNYLFSFEARGFNGDAAIGIDLGTVLNTSFTNFTGDRQTVVFEFTVTETTTATIRLNEFGGGDAFSGTLLDNLLLQKLADSILITATDNCGIETITPSVTGFGCNELGTQLVTLTVADESGNQASETVEVQVVDNTAPQFLTRESFIIFVDENGEASVTPTDYNRETVVDNCGVDRLEFDRTEFGCGDVGFHVINVTAFDASGNATTTQADVEVRDEIVPEFLTRESFIIFVDQNGVASLTPDQYNTATIQTNCDLDRVEFDRTEFGCGDVGFHVINVTAFDGNGLSTTTQADVEVRDEITPVITLTGDAIVEIDLGSPYLEAGADVADNCDAPLVIGGLVDTNVAGTYIITYNAVDENGNPATEVIRTVNVIQRDVEGPVITANDITAFTRDDRCSAVVEDYGVTATDESGVADITFNFNPGTVFSQGTTEVSATATDVFGNVSTATFNVTVIDNVSPTFDSNDITVVLDENGQGNLVVPNAPVEIFADDFESEAAGLNITALNDWNVTQGNVDVFFGGQFGLLTTNNSLELAGNVNGAIESRTPVVFEPGNYRLRIDYRGLTGDAAIGIDIGTLLGASITEFTNEFFEPAEFDFTVTETTSATIRFNEFGGGTVGSGTLIDNVRILRMPENGIISNVYDNCEVASIAASRTDFTCADVGPQTVIITVADAAGNQTSADITVNVVDNTAPQFLTRESFIIFVDENGEASVTPADYNRGTVVDNCGVDRIEFDRTEFDCGDVGFHVINVTAFDVNGLSTTTQADVEVRDEITPVITLTGDAIVEIDLGSPYLEAGADVADNCDAPLVIGGLVDTNVAGTYIITYNAVDENGNPATEVIRTVNVIQRDVEGPVITANDITAFTRDDRCSAMVEDYGVTATDESGVADITFNFNPGTVFSQGTTEVSATATDVFGNVSTARFNVTVIDNVSPTFDSNDITVVLDENGQGNLVVPNAPVEIFADDFESEAAGLNITALNDWNVTQGNVDVFFGGQFGLLTTNNSLELAGNVNGAIESRTPVVFEPGNYRLRIDYRGLTGDAAIGTDIGTLLGASITEFTNEFFEPAEFDFTVTETTSATIRFNEFGGGTVGSGTLIDNVRILRMPENGIISNVYDNCEVTSITASRTDFTCADVGPQTVTITVADAAGNQTSADITVNVVDNTAPQFLTRESFIIFVDENGEASVTPADYNRETVVDNCGVDRLEFDRTEFGCGDVGFHVINVTAFDVNGLSTTTQADVEVRDVIAPIARAKDITVLLDEAGNATITAEAINDGSSDNCGIDTLSIDRTVFDCDDIGGQNLVTLTVTDGNGLSATAQATVAVKDNLAPVVVSQNVTIALDANGNAVLTVADVDGGTADNCDFTLSINNDSFDCTSLGANTVILTATDTSGNSASAEAIVTVVDNVGPVTNDITVEVTLDENGEASVSLADVASAVSDNCGVSDVSFETTDFTCDNLGENVLSITATDASGNTSTGTITVIVKDILPPVVATENISLELDESGQATITPDDVLILSADEIDTGESCTVSAAEHHAVWLSQYVKNSGDDDDDDHYHKRRKGKGKGKGRDNDDDDDDDNHNRPENTRFVFDTDGGSLVRNDDGTASVTGTIRSTANTNDQWVVTLNLENARNWAEWSALGRSYKDEKGIANKRFMDWTYFEMGAGSVLTGTGINNGETIALTHAPSDFRYGFQLGEAANSKNGNFGLSGWFFYTNRKGKVVQGDFNLDVTDCTPNTPPSDVVVTNDNCSLGEITLSQSTFTCSDIGENTIQVTVADQSGNETVAMATVTISDNIAPVAVAQDITVSLGADGSVTIDSQLLDGGSTDNCAIVSYTLSRDTFTCADVQEDDHHYYGYYYWWKKRHYDQNKGQKVTLTVTDAAGNTDTAEAYVKVVDEVAPVISSEPVTIVVYGNRKEWLKKQDVAPKVTDNCGVKWINFPWRRYGVRDAGMNIVVVRAKDHSDNVTTGILNVEVIDISSYGRRVEICYNGQTKVVGRGAVQAWLRKGAQLGSCGTDLAMSTGGMNLDDAIEGELNPEPLIVLGAFPNPAQSETKIRFSSDVSGPATVAVMSTAGVRLTTLYDGEIRADENVEVTYNTSQLPNGMYIIRLVTAGEVKSMKLIVKK